MYGFPGVCFGYGDFASVACCVLLIPFPASRQFFEVQLPATGASAEATEQLIKRLGSSSFNERESAQKALIAIGVPAVPQLQSALKSSDPETARRARGCISEISKKDPIGHLLLDLDNPDAQLRCNAAARLAELGPKAKVALPALIQRLDDPDSTVQYLSLGALANMGPDAKEALPKVLSILKDPKKTANVRWGAANYLRTCGQPADSAIPELLRLLETDDPLLRNGAANALGALGKKHPEVVAALLKALRDEKESPRGAAARALAQIGQEPERCVPALLKALYRDRRALVADKERKHTGYSLDCILSALGAYGRDASQAVSAIYELAADKNEVLDYRLRAVAVLAAIGPESREKLILLTQATEPALSRSARKAVKNLPAMK